MTPKKDLPKIFDILPPQRYTEKITQKEEIVGRKPPRRTFSALIKGIFLILVILFFAGVISTFFFQKATLTIWPKTQKLDFKEQVIIDKNFKQYDFLARTIPGEFLQEEKITSLKEIPATGETSKDQKAEGTIRVYNAYSTSPQALIANTRFVSAEGKLLRSLDRINIPGGTYEGGKLQPGFVDIKVQADQSGEGYNIGPSTFSIPGFVGTPKYTAFYGKSFEPMKGGFKGKTSQITKQDLENAEKTLKDKLAQELDLLVKDKTSGKFVLLDGASKKEMENPIFSAKAGDTGETFTGEIKGTSTYLVFKESDLNNFAKDLILSRISQEQNLKEDSLSINYYPENIDFAGGKIILNLDLSATIYPNFDKEAFKRDLTGKSLSEVKANLATNSKIDKFNINLWPFWLPIIPSDLQKIKIILNID